jgi:glycosyltransferase involved in cell wall biosynthesis
MAEDSLGDGPLDLSVLLPAFNEQDAIVPVIDEIREALAEWEGDWEILVVDDASIDRTAEFAERAGARVIRRVENGGSGSARKTGIRCARGALVAMLDADGSYDPAHLPPLLSFFPDFDQVNGARTSEQGNYKVFRVPAKWAIRKLTEVVSGKTIPDLNTGMKIFKRDIMIRYLWVLPSGFSCVTSMTLAFLCNDHPVKYVPVPYRKRIGDSKFHFIKDSANYLLTAIRIIVYFRPLRIFLPVSSAIFVVAMAKGSYSVLQSPMGLHDFDVILSILAFIVLSVGVLADLIVAQRRNDSR